MNERKLCRKIAYQSAKKILDNSIYNDRAITKEKADRALRICQNLGRPQDYEVLEKAIDIAFGEQQTFPKVVSDLIYTKVAIDDDGDLWFESEDGWNSCSFGDPETWEVVQSYGIRKVVDLNVA